MIEPDGFWSGNNPYHRLHWPLLEYEEMSAGLRIMMLLTMALGAWPLAANILSGTVLEDHSGDPIAAVVLELIQAGQQQNR